jgi:hypothetical protein
MSEIDQIVFVYRLAGSYRVYSLKEARKFVDTRDSEKWVHIGTINARAWIEFILNEDPKIERLLR